MIEAPSILPATAVLEMTYECNHKCLFCSCPWYADASFIMPEMSISEWKELIKLYAENGVVSFAFTGGEPLLKESLYYLLRYTASQQAHHIETVDGELKSWFAPPEIYLLSNGKLVDEETLRLCAELKINLSISMPGLKTFAAHTRGGSPVENVLDIFSRAKELGIYTTAGITVTAENFNELYETIAAALIAGSDNILLNRFMPGGRGLQNRKLELTSEQTVEMAKIAEEVLALAKRTGSIGTEIPRCLIDPADYEYLKVGTQCSAGRDFFVIGPSGYIRVCNHSEHRLLYWRDYDELRHNPYWDSFVFKTWMPDACCGCDLIGECDGGCREAANVCYGSLNAPDPLLYEQSEKR
jgi:radical SAM protein with 4Fe4S-binding SPASM domain